MSPEHYRLGVQYCTNTLRAINHPHPTPHLLRLVEADLLQGDGLGPLLFEMLFCVSLERQVTLGSAEKGRGFDVYDLFNHSQFIHRPVPCSRVSASVRRDKTCFTREVSTHLNAHLCPAPGSHRKPHHVRVVAKVKSKQWLSLVIQFITTPPPDTSPPPPSPGTGLRV